MSIEIVQSKRWKVNIAGFDLNDLYIYYIVSDVWRKGSDFFKGDEFLTQSARFFGQGTGTSDHSGRFLYIKENTAGNISDSWIFVMPKWTFEWNVDKLTSFCYNERTHFAMCLPEPCRHLHFRCRATVGKYRCGRPCTANDVRKKQWRMNKRNRDSALVTAGFCWFWSTPRCLR